MKEPIKQCKTDKQSLIEHA